MILKARFPGSIRSSDLRSAFKMNVVAQVAAAPDYDRDSRFQLLFESAAAGIGITELDGRILETNSAFDRILGYGHEELVGTQLLEAACAEVFAADGRPDIKAPITELLRGERESFEIETLLHRKNGSGVWAHLTVSLARNVRRQPAFLVVMLADATDRKQFAERLREAETMGLIGRFAGGIAHDFNNLLTGILLYCDLLSAGLKNQERQNDGSVSSQRQNDGLQSKEPARNEWDPTLLRQHVEDVRLAGEQGAALTHQLLAITRRQAAEPRPIVVNAIVASTQNLLRRLIGAQVELIVSLDPVLDSTTEAEGGLVLADPAQLRQILLNLVLNARDAIAHSGTITVRTKAAEFPADPANRHAGARPRRAVSLAVQDDGCGMDLETQSHLFESLFTTKPAGEGTGLGLATVHRIVREVGGMIEVDSAPGRGTRVAVLFPTLDPTLALAPPHTEHIVRDNVQNNVQDTVHNKLENTPKNTSKDVKNILP
jgi:two-component system, cell cycle sensor histidine kinase and response regulator CckA